jgi:protein TonB
MSQMISYPNDRILGHWRTNGDQLTITLFVVLLTVFICKAFGFPGKLPEPPKGRIPGVIAVANLEGKRPLILVRPKYPETAMKAGIEGDVDLDIVIGKTGKIEMLRVIRGSPLLAGAAADAVGQWRYEPILLNGKPVRIRTTVNVGFKLSRDKGGSLSGRPSKND